MEEADMTLSMLCDLRDATGKVTHCPARHE